MLSLRSLHAWPPSRPSVQSLLPHQAACFYPISLCFLFPTPLLLSPLGLTNAITSFDPSYCSWSSSATCNWNVSPGLVGQDRRSIPCLVGLHVDFEETFCFGDVLAFLGRFAPLSSPPLSAPYLCSCTHLLALASSPIVQFPHSCI